MAEIPGEPRRSGPALAVVLVLLAVVVGAAAGLVLGRHAADTATPGTLTAAEPVPGTSPAYPRWVPYSPDTTDPPLATDLAYRTDWIDDGADRWKVSLPVGWVIVKDSSLAKGREARFAPSGAIDAGYSLRIKRLDDSDHPGTPEQMRDRQLNTLRGADYDDFEVFRKDIDSIGFTYRTPESAAKPNLHRWNIWTWVTPPGGRKAGLEISVGGRKVDQAGLNDLLRTVADSARPDPAP